MFGLFEGGRAPGRAIAFALMGCYLASGQTPLDSNSQRGRSEIAFAARALDGQANDTISCKLRPLDPVLNFNFRYQAGYQVTLPLKEFPTERVTFRSLVRVKSLETGHDYYFSSDRFLAAGPRPGNLLLQTGGGYFLGEGSYQAELTLSDSLGRSCHKQWSFRLRTRDEDEGIVRLLEPGTVAPLLLDPWVRTPLDRPYRISVIMHLAPMSPGRGRLTANDRSLLISTVIALLEQTPFHEVSVHGVSFQQQREVFSSGPLDRSGLNKLTDALEELELGTVDLDQLSNPKGYVDLLAKLVNREITSPDPPDAIVFIGPNSRFIDKFPRERIETTSAPMPEFFYLHLDYNSRRFPWADTIQRLTSQQSGKVFKIYRARDFASAIGTMEDILAERSHSAAD